MKFFCYCRDREGAGGTRRALLQAHWAYMRSYIPAMVARGPTMSEDGRTVTGSLHIVDLPDAAAAHEFVEQDPLWRGGVFEESFVRGFRNESGRTMWQFAGDAGRCRFLYVAQGREAHEQPGSESLTAQRDYLARASAAVIVWGALLGLDGERWCGTAILLEAADASAARALAAADPLHHRGAYGATALHPWRFGGEENLRDLVRAP